MFPCIEPSSAQDGEDFGGFGPHADVPRMQQRSGCAEDREGLGQEQEDVRGLC